MKEPKNPGYSEEEINKVNEIIKEYENLKKDPVTISKYIDYNLSKEDIKIRKKEEVISTILDKLPFYLCIIIIIVIDIILVNKGGFQTTERKIIAFLSYAFIGFLAGFPIVAITSTIIIWPFSSLISLIYKSSFERLHNKIDLLKNEYQIGLSKKYEKIFNIKREINDYQEELKKYQDYLIRTEKEFWYSLDGHSFENEIAKIFKKEGFDTKISKVGADGGVDIVVSKNHKRYAVQCKAHTSKISESVARDLYGVLHSKNFDGGYLITLNGTSSKTKEFCENNKDKPIIIWTINDILKKTK